MLQHSPEKSKPARVVILGAKGFIARALKDNLAKHGIPTQALSSAELDLTTAGAPEKLRSLIRKDDAVVMTSALTPDKGKDVKTLMANLRMAESLCAALETAPCAHLVYLSSDAVYDERLSLLREDSACQPGNLYAAMHHTREQMLRYAAGLSKTPYLVLRPSAVYGPGDTHNAYGPNRFVRSALKDSKIALFGEGEETRDHVFIDDVISLLRSCLERRSAGTLNLVSGQALSFMEVARKAAAACGGKTQIQGAPRGGPITHKHFEVTELVKSFPDFRPTPFDVGLAALVRAERG